MLADERYPIGRFAPPARIDEDVLGAWREAVAHAPERLREAVDGLSGSQLDTPYRDGGWSVRQVVHHLPDAHLHTYLRFKWALAEDEPSVAGYDQAGWAALPDSLHGPIEPAMRLYDALHARWTVLLDAMELREFERRYLNPRTGEPRSLGITLGLYAWHGEHHVAQIVALRRRLGW
ncbi:MAG TPA: putative metal-dependent hydrolase [Trueperaceae bacterium]|nr:putative metal-dependent hydrolase [Trueperaceae bacterium]